MPLVGNPYTIGEHGDRAEVIARHRADLLSNTTELRRARHELAGKSLICFCAPAACHGDTLLWVANCPGEEFELILVATETDEGHEMIVKHLMHEAHKVGAMYDDSRERRAARKRIAAEIALINLTHPIDAARVAHGYTVGAEAHTVSEGAVSTVLVEHLFPGKKALLDAHQVRDLAHDAARIARSVTHRMDHAVARAATAQE